MMQSGSFGAWNLKACIDGACIVEKRAGRTSVACTMKKPQKKEKHVSGGGLSYGLLLHKFTYSLRPINIRHRGSYSSRPTIKQVA